ncbi:hypothetical protein F5Y01DRAFT_310235 [Xylaria sp. FL0043]|nr:hypothetical protein F5Y01DRAFT_310235 [Xylaria sp. FL0043]
MTDATYVVMPVRADGSPSQQDHRQMAAAIQESLQEKLHPDANGEDSKPNHERDREEDHGPLKRVMANSDSLYNYISWDDPARTLGSYFALLGLMYAVHLFHWTQLLLKMGAIGLGVVYVASLASRWSESDPVSRIRPKCKQVPESNLNATLKDIHDLIQYLTIQIQKTLYGEELGKTLGAFFGLTTLFWLVKLMSPFNLGVLGLSLAYITPLICSTGGREITHCAKVHAQELAHTTVESTKVAMKDIKNKASDLPGRTQQTATNIASKTQNAASDISPATQNMAENLSAKTQHTATNTVSHKQTLSEISNGAVQQPTEDTQPSTGDVTQERRQSAAQRYAFQRHVQRDSMIFSE